MTNYKEILRLHSQGVSGRQISSCLSCSRNTLAKVIKKAGEQGLTWPLPVAMSNQEIGNILFPKTTSVKYQKEPDYKLIHSELAKSGITLSLLWHEYVEQCRNSKEVPYMYTQFCKYYHDYAIKNNVTMRLTHKPGEN